MDSDNYYETKNLNLYSSVEGQPSLTYQEKQRILAISRFQYGYTEVDMTGLDLIERYVIIKPVIILKMNKETLSAAHFSKPEFCYLGAVMKKNDLLVILKKMCGGFCADQDITTESFYIDHFYTPLFGGIDLQMTLFQKKNLDFLPESAVLFSTKDE